MKNLVCFICHFMNDDAINRFNIIKNGLPEGWDIIFCSPTPLDNTYNIKEFECYNIPANIYIKDLAGDGRVKNPLNNICYIRTRKKYNNYNKYWFIEYDVVFKDNKSWRWTNFFNDHNIPVDLLCHHLNKYNKKYSRGYWNIPFIKHVCAGVKDDIVINNNEIVKYKELFIGFLPVCMLSDKLLDLMTMHYETFGEYGFFEFIIPTLAHHYNLKMQNISDKYYYINDNPCPHWGINNGSISWYVEDKSKYDDNMLIHPVK